MRTVTFLCLLCAALMASVVAQDTLNRVVGSELTLELKSPTPQIQRVVWKHGVNLVADMTLGRFSSYGPFKCCATINADGHLIIKDIKPVHAGLYSVEVNNKVQDQQYNVRVFNSVPRPTVRTTPLTCSYRSEYCSLVCEVNAAEDDLTFEWLFETELSERTGKELRIVPGVDKAPTYSCRVKNPVSEADSEPMKNPLIPPPGNPLTPYLVAVLVIVLILLVIVGLAWWKREDIKKRCGKGGGDGQHGNSNNNRPEETGPRTETQPLSKPESVGTGEKPAPTDEADANTNV